MNITVKRSGNLDKVVSGLSKSALAGIKSAIYNTHKSVIQTKHNMTSGIGELDNFINHKITIDLETVKEGKVYAEDDRLMFLEYGTGTKAELPHIGKTKTFHASGFRYWFLPADKSPRDFGQDRAVIINGNKFYIMFPMAPRPIFRTTAFNRRYDNAEDVKSAIKDMIRGCAL